MFSYKDILKDESKDHDILREKSVDVVLPLSDEDKECLRAMNEYLRLGYDEEYTKRHDIRPGVGIAAPQIGVLKKMFVIMAYDEKGDFHNYLIINPKIISHSEEKTYLESGEGCLSVETNYRGYIHRHKRIKASCFLYNIENDTVESTTLSLKNYLAVIFQHEYDHLFGVLFFDHIDKFNPFYIPENSKPVKFD